MKLFWRQWAYLSDSGVEPPDIIHNEVTGDGAGGQSVGRAVGHQAPEVLQPDTEPQLGLKDLDLVTRPPVGDVTQGIVSLRVGRLYLIN